MSPLDFDGLKDKLNANQGSGWKPKPGENEIRVLPPTKRYFDDAISSIGYEFRTHFLRLEGRDLEVFRCLRDFDEKCPACEFFFQHRNDDDEGVAETADKFGNSQRFAINIFDVADPDSGVQRYEVGPMIHNGLLEYIANARWGDCLHPGSEGRNFFLKFTPGNEHPSGYNRYDVEPDPNQSSVLEVLPEEFADQLDGLEAVAPDRKSAESIQELVKETKVRLGILDPTPPPASTPQTPSTPQGGGVPKGGGGTAVPETPPAETTGGQAADPDPAPSAQAAGGGDSGKGPEIDPDTGKPVCYGDFNKDVHPCAYCDVEADCQLKTLGLGG